MSNLTQPLTQAGFFDMAESCKKRRAQDLNLQADFSAPHFEGHAPHPDATRHLPIASVSPDKHTTNGTARNVAGAGVSNPDPNPSSVALPLDTARGGVVQAGGV